MILVPILIGRIESSYATLARLVYSLALNVDLWLECTVLIFHLTVLQNTMILIPPLILQPFMEDLSDLTIIELLEVLKHRFDEVEHFGRVYRDCGCSI